MTTVEKRGFLELITKVVNADLLLPLDISIILSICESAIAREEKRREACK